VIEGKWIDKQVSSNTAVNKKALQKYCKAFGLQRH
jgi:hypothetical protein